MGEIRVEALLENERDLGLCREGKLAKKRIRAAVVNALVDTGAVEILLPRELVEKLGLHVFDKMTVILADDRKIELECAGAMTVTIAGRTMKTDCLVGPPGCEPLIGQIVLERLDLVLDPRQRTLAPRPESPWRASLKMKAARQAAQPVSAP